MSDVKIVASFLIPGGKMYEEEECKEASRPMAGYKHHAIKVEYPNKFYNASHPNGQPRYKQEVIQYTTRNSKPATKVIKMSQEAYVEMCSNPPRNIKNRAWKSIPIEKRIEAHLDVMKEEFNAYSYTYNISGD
jgi:hypothetical protein